jgi:hypothetical protein
LIYKSIGRFDYQARGYSEACPDAGQQASPKRKKLVFTELSSLAYLYIIYLGLIQRRGDCALHGVYMVATYVKYISVNRIAVGPPTLRLPM